MKPTRVAIIHPFLFRYARGIERITFNLANALSALGIEMHLLTWRWKPSIRIDTLDPDVRVHAFPTSRYFASKAIVPFYTMHLIKHAYDFIWVYFAGYGEAETLNIVRRQSYGIVFHYPYTQVPHRYREFQQAGLLRRAAQVVSASRYVAHGVRESLGRDSTVIYHGVDTQHFAPDASARSRIRELLGLPTDAPLLITVADLEERKGVQWVLRALPAILHQVPGTTYLVLGDGSHRAALEQEAHALGIQTNVRFLGVQANVVPFYQAADIFLLFSHGEALPNAPLEAMAIGLPLIVAEQRPFDEIVLPEYGVCVPEKDSAQAAQVVVDLLNNPARRQAMGAAGRKRIQNDFVWERVADQYLELMQSK